MNGETLTTVRMLRRAPRPTSWEATDHAGFWSSSVTWSTWDDTCVVKARRRRGLARLVEALDLDP